ncbi:ribose 5-phosphate isomerase A [Pyrococcus horikoshii]|uniref:Ribose-5-phosphate isomerase A n=2 Tax=Pyrococcus horikoshii TaxID=53953 RepID=RPIA_PYRHO|nr:ribose 5-phosphate isomerase A [Pyrococcus horikoshii]O50083.1 RecName: Full=Ribose-5-phosphate isomerase A; AltName: Full=Phosphoriboisomerase A; Short=PRI [Pyrococcus horikoshii OT3]1LK5_A Chain A, D-Ribose-5-Phosphate Isomerase [Pyrococcus horikoshii]1LK5_B Chain B, D-Ribose-5-Phosphate Isomerase [Pyrococcus horikoshii]1LK5_C Chain C, D-Ribose-5-Phosphate Isomerase [Pyrococcus horikoshii]1LK5_D Chain D, D-Ribose-5-Phosphate Isomerase [Pyrococcus horikoshii]1LK7_A Chain A, D-Ribose-5-Pho
MNVEEMKKIAAKEALKFIEDDMVIGLGTGSTTAYFIKLLGEKLKRGEISDIVGVPTSYQAKLLAIEHDIPIASLDQVDAIDVAVDGADEVDPNLNLIKGRGAALTMEKIIEYRAGTFIVLVDERKLVDYLCQKMPVPIEVIPQAWKAIIEELSIFNAKAELRMGVNKDGPVITDNGNFIIDAKFPRIDDPLDMEIELNTIPGVIENGIFADIADIVIVGTREGVKKLER